MRSLFILLFFLLLISCNSKKQEWEIVWINDLPKLIWEEKNIPCYSSQKKDRWVITSPIISLKKIPHNVYHNGLDTVLISSYCFYDAILLSENDLDIEYRKLIEFHSIFPNIIATNVYIKYNMKGFNKYYIKEIAGKKNVIYSVIVDSTSPLKSFYLNDYRIENPLFEINRLNTKLKPNSYIIFLFTNKKIEIRNKNFLVTIINSLTPKPQIIFANIDKKIKISNTFILPYPQTTETIKAIKIFGFTKLKTYPILSEINYKSLPKLTEIINKTSKDLNVNLLINSKPLNEQELTMLIAKGITNFMFSDLVIISNDTVNCGVKPGVISHEDIYKIIKNPEDKLVYIKAKGDNIQNIIQTYEKNSIIYINSKNIVDGKSIFDKSRIYRIITTIDFIKQNDDILNFIMEFSVLNIKIKQPIMWYFKKVRKI
ncbi:MAG: hypothetical protein N2Z20_00510 [Elusimicrobiales bacterium]|nr:hypothetical protein [Elusimicrobiales bacterium]